MASEAKLKNKPRNTTTFLTAAAVTRGEVCQLNGSGAVTNAGSNATTNIGIFLEDGDDATYVRVALQCSICLAVAYDNAISQGDDLVAATDGRVDTAAATTAATTFIVAKALSGSDVAGQLIPVMVTVYTRVKSAS